ncbi:MAG: OsmC family protein [Bacteroidetes bacterium]|nr:OsmC family protein [Bacteroidota bacterium]MBK8365552.1 OsmC family protein [Bacteroidota bacterium]MBK9412255.1 OsmC family protein [Bacteroidota bacterium]MBL0031835.1 OsmC family protein [Bacteroidota bacterium]MBP6426854.1 OsmC family protein [Bacteroidia bacterium]
MNEHLYNVDLKWVSDRNGIISSPELDLAFNVATPPQFPKGIPGIWSPEHLLTAAVVSCFMTTFLAIAENSKLEYSAFSCTSSGKLEQIEGKFLMTEITLNPVLTLNNSADTERAERILVKSEAACLISNSIKSKIILNTSILAAV